MKGGWRFLNPPLSGMRNFFGYYEPSIPVGTCQVCGRPCQSSRVHYDRGKYLFETICLICQDLTANIHALDGTYNPRESIHA